MENKFRSGDLVKVTRDPKCRTCYRHKKRKCLCNKILMLVKLEPFIKDTVGEHLPPCWTAVGVDNRVQYSVWEDWIHQLSA